MRLTLPRYTNITRYLKNIDIQQAGKYGLVVLTKNSKEDQNSLERDFHNRSRQVIANLKSTHPEKARLLEILASNEEWLNEFDTEGRLKHSEVITHSSAGFFGKNRTTQNIVKYLNDTDSLDQWPSFSNK